MKKSVKDQTARAFQVGGYNPPSIPQQPYTQLIQVYPQTLLYVLPGIGLAGYHLPCVSSTGFTPYFVSLIHIVDATSFLLLSCAVCLL